MKILRTLTPASSKKYKGKLEGRFFSVLKIGLFLLKNLVIFKAKIRLKRALGSLRSL